MCIILHILEQKYLTNFISINSACKLYTQNLGHVVFTEKDKKKGPRKVLFMVSLHLINPKSEKLAMKT